MDRWLSKLVEESERGIRISGKRSPKRRCGCLTSWDSTTSGSPRWRRRRTCRSTRSSITLGPKRNSSSARWRRWRSAQLAQFVVGRGSGEPVIAFLRRHLRECIEKIREVPRDQDGAEGFAAMRHVYQGSPALQVHAVHRARSVGRRIEDDLTAALARDARGWTGRPHSPLRGKPDAHALRNPVDRSRAAPAGRTDSG